MFSQRRVQSPVRATLPKERMQGEKAEAQFCFFRLFWCKRQDAPTTYSQASSGSNVIVCAECGVDANTRTHSHAHTKLAGFLRTQNVVTAPVVPWRGATPVRAPSDAQFCSALPCQLICEPLPLPTKRIQHHPDFVLTDGRNSSCMHAFDKQVNAEIPTGG